MMGPGVIVQWVGRVFAFLITGMGFIPGSMYHI